MNEALLNQIRGRKISGFSLVKYPRLGLDRVILNLDGGQAFDFKAKEVKLGPYEAYTLCIGECSGETGIERVDAHWTVGIAKAIERQDWLEPADDTIKTVGNNPMMHMWGVVGSVPKHASHAITVTSSVILISPSREHQAMISLAEYPGLVAFTTNAQEISVAGRPM